MVGSSPKIVLRVRPPEASSAESGGGASGSGVCIENAKVCALLRFFKHTGGMRRES
jgi:hypothetical protein